MCIIYIFADLDGVTSVADEAATKTAYTVKWTETTGNKLGYIVDCNCTETDHLTCTHNRSQLLLPGTVSYECTNLTPGSTYQSHVTTVKPGFDDVLVSQVTSSQTGESI